MQLVEVIKPILLASVINKFIKAYREPQNLAMAVAMMKQGIVTAPTYLRAVKDQKGRYLAYLWATVLGGTCFVQHVYSDNRQARKILFADLEKWCRTREIKVISGLTRLDNNTPAFSRWMTRQGYKPVNILYVKQLEG